MTLPGLSRGKLVGARGLARKVSARTSELEACPMAAAVRKKGDVLKAPELIAQIDLASTRKLRVAIKRDDDGLSIDLRSCALLSVTSRIFMPTAAGFALTPDAARALVEALQAALAVIKNDGSAGNIPGDPTCR